MKKPFVYIVFVLFLTFILILYRYLGGFNEPMITFEPVKAYTFYGVNYEGNISDRRMENLFSDMRNLKIEGHHKGPLVMVWFNEPRTRQDTINVFVGIEILTGEPVPEKYDSLRIEMKGLVRATMHGHTSVLPVPLAIVEKINAYAVENNYSLQDVLIDKYLSDSVIYTEIPVKSEPGR